jgi:hypothetical protein
LSCRSRRYFSISFLCIRPARAGLVGIFVTPFVDGG